MNNNLYVSFHQPTEDDIPVYQDSDMVKEIRESIREVMGEDIIFKEFLYDNNQEKEIIILFERNPILLKSMESKFLKDLLELFQVLEIYKPHFTEPIEDKGRGR